MIVIYVPVFAGLGLLYGLEARRAWLRRKAVLRARKWLEYELDMLSS